MGKPNLTQKALIKYAKKFCESESIFNNKELFGITDGKAVGTYVEQKFKSLLIDNFTVEPGNSAMGIDLPSDDIMTDIKVTSITQPQSSCPFKNAQQKIYGLGYNLLVFVYSKKDNSKTNTAKLDFVSCSFIEAKRTADYQITKSIKQMLKNSANVDDIIAYLNDRNIPADEIAMRELALQILKHPPEQGYLTISNALQWRLQYGRIVELTSSVPGIKKIVNKVV